MIHEYEGVFTMPNFIGLCLFVSFLGAIFFITQMDKTHEEQENYYKKKQQSNPGRRGKMGDRVSQNLRADSERYRRIINNSRNR